MNYFEGRQEESDTSDSSGCCIIGDGETKKLRAKRTREDGATSTPKRKQEHIPSCMKAERKYRSLLMDKYDVRVLFDDYSSLREHQPRRQNPMASKATCITDEAAPEEHLLKRIKATDMQDGLDDDLIEDMNFDRFGALPEYRHIFLIGQDHGTSSAEAGAKTTVDETEEPFELSEDEVKDLPRDVFTVSDWTLVLFLFSKSNQKRQRRTGCETYLL